MGVNGLAVTGPYPIELRGLPRLRSGSNPREVGVGVAAGRGVSPATRQIRAAARLCSGSNPSGVGRRAQLSEENAEASPLRGVEATPSTLTGTSPARVIRCRTRFWVP